VIQPASRSCRARPPREQERRFEVEDDEQDRDEVEAHVELAARVLEGGKAALVFAELLGVRVVRPVSRATPSAGTRTPPTAQRDDQEDQDRQ
jgi:hypothetical protein